MENMEVIERKISLPTSEHPGEGMEEFQYKEADLSDTLEAFKAHDDLEREKDLNEQKGQNTGVYLNPANENSSTENVSCEEKEAEPVFDGTEIPELEARNLVPCSLENVPDGQGSAWPEKAVALKNFVKAKSTIAVSTVLRHLSVKKGEDEQVLSDNQHNNATTGVYMCEESPPEAKLKENIQKIGEWPTWKPLSFVKIGRDAESDLKTGQTEATHVEHSLEEPAMKGRIIIYTGLGCNESKEVRLFMHQKRLKYIEINVDIFPNRKQELEKYVGSSSVPMIFFNDIPIGGLSELKALDDLGDLAERIKALEEEPSPSAPFPPLPGEDDISGSGMIDELASIVRKMKESIILKDRFYKMRRFSNCFLGSEAVDFLSEDQYLEREEAVEFGRMLVSKYLFHHVLEYLRIIEELHRVELDNVPREEKLAFFINLYNMMAIHAILTWGYPDEALDRRKYFGDFKYVIGGCTYPLSSIQNGILRGNQRPPYNLSRPFGSKDKRCKVSLPYSEPLIHFALVSGSRSGPALRCYSPGNIDRELIDAARSFLRCGGLVIDTRAKVASVNKILKWYSVDFGKNEIEVMRHAANYLEPAESEELLELLASSQLKVAYQPFDWGLNR